MNTGHVALLGDSIFDNAVYVPGGPSVIQHLGSMLPSGWRATLLAVDGAVVDDVLLQLEQLGNDVTHLVMSAGGNNALWSKKELMEGSKDTSIGQMRRMADVHARFESSYRRLLEAMVEVGKPTTVCTIYDAIPGLAIEELTGLCLFNDVIINQAIRAGISIVDLRQICTDLDDYSEYSPIEPSRVGGKKIAGAIVRAVVDGPLAGRARAVYGA